MQKEWKHPKPECLSFSKGLQLLTSKETRLDGEWVWWIDRKWLQKVGNNKFLWAKEHVLTQCKETKNLEKMFDEMLPRINSLEKNINELMELKNTTWELCKAYTSFNSWIDQAEETLSETEDQLNEIKWKGKIREKRVKRNEQSLQEIWDYVKRPNLCLMGVPECDGGMNPS